MTAPDAPKPIDGIAAVYRLLPQLAGALLGLTALAYVAGWMTQQAYFSHLGAPWANNLLPSITFLTASVLPIAALFLTIPNALWITHSSNKKRLRLCVTLSLLSIGFAIGAAVLAHFLRAHTHRPFYALLAAMASAFFFAGAGGYVLALVRVTVPTGAPQGKGLAWNTARPVVLLSGLYLAFAFSPIELGTAIADYATTPAARGFFPRVILATTHPAHLFDPTASPWRLVTTFSGDALLFQFAPNQDRHIFRVVPLTKIRGICPNDFSPFAHHQRTTKPGRRPSKPTPDPTVSCQ